jgi:hypothetical protein
MVSVEVVGERGVLASKAPPNNSLHLTGISLSFIENLSHDAVVLRQVNSGVRLLPI